MATLARSRARQMDIIEWLTAHRAQVKVLTAERWSLEKGVLDYLKDGASFVSEMRAASRDRKAKNEKENSKQATTTEKKPLVLSAMDQYFMSQELLKRMKWKRVTWDQDADYESFSRRMFDNDSLFAKVGPMSFMTLHITRDPSAAGSNIASPSAEARQITSITPGTLTKWFLESVRCPIDSPLRKPVLTTVSSATRSRSPVSVDWEAGSVRILDSITAQEMQTYLQTTAPRVMALQQKMEDEQAKITEDVEEARIRLHATAIKFNKHDRSFWDDPERKIDPDYVTPAELKLFISSVFKSGFLLRCYLKNNQIRVVPSGRPYGIDPVEKEIRIPANFAEYNFLRLHGRWEALERVANAFRATSMVWFFVGMMLVGDFEVL